MKYKGITAAICIVAAIFVFGGCKQEVTGNPYVANDNKQLTLNDKYVPLSVSTGYRYSLPEYIVGDNIKEQDFLTKGTLQDTAKTIEIEQSDLTVAKYKINTFLFYITPIEFSENLSDMTAKGIEGNAELQEVLGASAVLDTSTFEKQVDESKIKINVAIKDNPGGGTYSGYISLLQQNGSTYMMYIVFADADTELQKMFADISPDYNEEQAHHIAKTFDVDSFEGTSRIDGSEYTSKVKASKSNIDARCDVLMGR